MGGFYFPTVRGALLPESKTSLWDEWQKPGPWAAAANELEASRQGIATMRSRPIQGMVPPFATPPLAEPVEAPMVSGALQEAAFTPGRAVQEGGRIMLTNRPEYGPGEAGLQLPAEMLPVESTLGGGAFSVPQGMGRGAFTPGAAPLQADVSEQDFASANPILQRQWLENKAGWQQGQLPQSELAQQAAKTKLIESQAGLAGAQTELTGAQEEDVRKTPAERAQEDSFLAGTPLPSGTTPQQYVDQLTQMEVVKLFQSAGINPAKLSQAQLQMFRAAALQRVVENLSRTMGMARARNSFLS